MGTLHALGARHALKLRTVSGNRHKWPQAVRALACDDFPQAGAQYNLLGLEYCVAPACRALDNVCLFDPQWRPGEPFQFDGACTCTPSSEKLGAYKADTSGCCGGPSARTLPGELDDQEKR